MTKRYALMAPWTVARAMTRTRRRIDEIMGALADLATTWDDVEPGTVAEVHAMAREIGRDLDQLAGKLEQWIAEKTAAGEAIGP